MRSQASGSVRYEAIVFASAMLIAAGTVVVRDTFPAFFCLGLFALAVPVLLVSARRRSRRLPMSGDALTGASTAGIAAGLLAVDGWIVELVYIGMVLVVALSARIVSWPAVEYQSNTEQN